MSEAIRISPPMIVKLIAFEELHPGDLVQSYYRKVKRTKNNRKAIGIVPPMFNPPIIKRNESVLVCITGTIYMGEKEKMQLS